MRFATGAHAIKFNVRAFNGKKMAFGIRRAILNSVQPLAGSDFKIERLGQGRKVKINLGERDALAFKLSQDHSAYQRLRVNAKGLRLKGNGEITACGDTGASSV